MGYVLYYQTFLNLKNKAMIGSKFGRLQEAFDLVSLGPWGFGLGVPAWELLLHKTDN